MFVNMIFEIYSFTPISISDSTKRHLPRRDRLLVLRDHSSSSHPHLPLRVLGVCQDVSDLLHYSGRRFVLRGERSADGLSRPQYLRGFRPGRDGLFRQDRNAYGESNDIQV